MNENEKSINYSSMKFVPVVILHSWCCVVLMLRKV